MYEKNSCIYLCLVLIGGNHDVTLEDVLACFTGSGTVPPMAASLHFKEQNPYPTASTCSLSLTLPTKYSTYSDFKNNFLFAIQNHGDCIDDSNLDYCFMIVYV